MLGQLLHSVTPRRNASGRAVTPQSSLESVAENAHTFQLLFPDASQLNQREGHAYPLSGPSPSAIGHDASLVEIDLEQSRDIRIIIAQDDSGSNPRTILFDSKPGSDSISSPNSPDLGTPYRHIRRTSRSSLGKSASANVNAPSHSRRSSLGLSAGSARSPPTVGAFLPRTDRSSSVSGLPNIDESATGRPREHDELIKTCLDCMFGNTAMSYRGPSNKLHIIPLEHKPQDAYTSPILNEGSGSLGRSEGRKRSNLAMSFTPTDPPPIARNLVSNSPEGAPLDRRRTILITRTFSVSLPDDFDASETTLAPQSPPNEMVGSQAGGFGQSSSGPKLFLKNPPQRRPRNRRTPMYGITVILHLPVSNPLSQYGGSSRIPAQVSRFNARSNPGRNVHSSLSSSADSERRDGWTLIDSASDSLLSASFSSDVDDRVNVVGQHWDVITRTLTNLQSVVQQRIQHHIREADLKSPVEPPPERTLPFRISERDLYASASRRIVKLRSYALKSDEETKQAIAASCERMVMGIRIRRVVTGQGRWGVWRDEARSICRWGGGKEQNFFFFNLLTAFLGCHQEWLSILGPKSYRRRTHEMQRSSAFEDLTVASRTVIVSADKMTARRLTFLLAAFLPSSNLAPGTSSPHRPSTSASMRAYSQSPPNTTLSRQPSLRRAITQSKAKRAASASAASLHAGDGSPSNSELTEDGNESQSTVSNSAQHPVPLAIIADDPEEVNNKLRKIRTAPAPRIISENAPVTNFSLARTETLPGTVVAVETNGGSSLASANLRQTLQRSDSSEGKRLVSQNATSGGRWPSIGTLWGRHIRRESSESNEILQTTDDGLGISGLSINRPTEQRQTQVVQTRGHCGADSEELYQHDLMEEDYNHVSDHPACSPNIQKAQQNTVTRTKTPPNAQDIPRTSHSGTSSRFKLSVNEDGIVDVDIPMLGASPQSPIFSGMSYEPSLGEASSLGPTSSISTCTYPHHDSDRRVNVAGWVAKFHADFALQSVAPYPELEAQIKSAMRAEPTPVAAINSVTPDSGSVEKWVDVCSTLIADTRSFTIQRLNLRRHVRLTPAPLQPINTPGASSTHQLVQQYQQQNFSSSNTSIPSIRSQYGNPYITSALSLVATIPAAENILEERFTHETVLDMDDTLVNAVERVLTNGYDTQDRTSTTTHISSLAEAPHQQQIDHSRGRRFVREDSATDDETPVGATSNPANETSSRQDARQTILGSLRAVVRAVANDLETSGEKQDGQTADPTPAAAVKPVMAGAEEMTAADDFADRSYGNARAEAVEGNSGRGDSGRPNAAGVGVRESTLTEGIRRWLVKSQTS